MPSTETEIPTPELMLAFYRRIYPFKSIFKWLNHEHTPSRLFTHREIAFTLQTDVYLRYNSFATADEFKKQTCTLNPTRFEIGPVYTARVRLWSLSRLKIPILMRNDLRFQASGQEDRATRRIFSGSKGARFRYRYDRLRWDPNVLFWRGHLQTLLGFHPRRGPGARLDHTAAIWLQASALGVLGSSRNSSVDIGQRGYGTDG